MSAVTFELPYNFVHTAHTVSQHGLSDEQQRKLDAPIIEWHEAYPIVQTASIGVVEATILKLKQEMQVWLGRNKSAVNESELMSIDSVLVGRPLEVTQITMRVKDIGIGKSIMTFDIDDEPLDENDLF